MRDCINEWDYWREQPPWAQDLIRSLRTAEARQFTDDYQRDYYELFGHEL